MKATDRRIVMKIIRDVKQSAAVIRNLSRSAYLITNIDDATQALHIQALLEIIFTIGRSATAIESRCHRLLKRTKR